MTSPTLSDLRQAYYGGGSAAEYAFLQQAQAAGIGAAGTLAVVANSAMFKIAEHAPLANVANLSVDIPSDYESIVLVGALQSNNVGTTDGGSLTFNNDVDGTNYASQSALINAALVTATQSIAAVGSRNILLSTGTTSNVNDFGTFRIEIPHYKNAVITKVATIQSSCPATRAAAGLFLRQAMFHWRSILPINNIKLYPANGTLWLPGSFISAYGIKAAG